MKDASPFFIVGSARSGTTLLRLMLNAHPDVAVPPESRFITELWRGEDEADVEDFLERLAGHERFRHWDLPITAVRAELGTEERAPYHKLAQAPHRAFARAHGKKRWGDKTPRYVEHIDFLLRLFPDARFVHLVRDGRNVALSYADVPFGPKTIARAAALWARRVSAGMASGRRLEAGRYVEVHYENLVEDPEGETKKLCRFLALPFDPAMLEHTERARAAVLPTAARNNPHLSVKPTPGVRSWQRAMSAREVEIFEAVAGQALSELGYERRFPRPSLAAQGAARLGLLGLPIARLAGTRRTEERVE